MTYPQVPRQSWALFYQSLIYEFCPGKPSFTEEQYPSLEGKVVVVTGANTGVGFQTAKSLLGATNAKVYMFSRNEQKSLSAIDRLKEEVAEEYGKKEINIHFIRCDLGDLTTLKSTVEEFSSKENRLDIIIHNAGVMVPPAEAKTKQGYELQWGTNVVGTFLLQKLLDPIFLKTAQKNAPNKSRIVWVSSSGHLFSVEGGINWEDINYELQPNEKFQKYGQSKAALCMLAIQYRKHHKFPNAVSVTMCPGYYKTELQRYGSKFQNLIYRMILQHPRYGAYTELFGALSPELTIDKEVAFVIPYGKVGIMRPDIRAAGDGEGGIKLWEYLEEETGKYL